jgi:hypothetical protein
MDIPPPYAITLCKEYTKLTLTEVLLLICVKEKYGPKHCLFGKMAALMMNFQQGLNVQIN